jgi:type VI secretion system secreted protein VgrG
MPAADQSDYSSKNRCLRLTLSGISGELHAISAEISEGVNQLFRADVVFTSHAEIDPQKLIGSKAQAEFIFAMTGDKDSTSHTINGVVTEIEFQSASQRGGRQCRIVIQPALWRLSQSSDHRIWQQMSAVDVVETLIREYNLPSAEFRVQQQVPVVEYSVQYGETDFDYLIRRLEIAGLFWWFLHEQDQHKLCIGDQASSWIAGRDWPDATTSFYLNNRQVTQDLIYRWQETFRYVPRARAGADWNFEMPDKAITAQVPSLIHCADAVDKELFSYPAGAQTAEEAEHLQKLHMQADEAQYCAIEGQSTVHVLAPARIFTPAFAQGGQLPDHVITGVVHHISAAAPVSGEQTPFYYNHFTAIPADVALIPQCKQTSPHIETTQIAVVAGPEKEQIHCDKYGRVKLWFPWDRRAKKDGSDTCWIRCAQIWSGANYGAQIIPRVGTEVVVSFLNGNPDHPVIMGTVANPQTMPAYTLPDIKSRLTLRSQSYKGDGFNELSLEDTAGEENFFTSAQKERTETVGGSDYSRIALHQIQQTGGHQAQSIAGNYKTEAAGSVHLAVGGSGADAEKIFGNLSDLNSKTAKLLDQGAGLASGAGRDGMKALAKALRGKKLGFWSQDATQKQSDFLKNDAGLDAGKKLAELGTKLGEDVGKAFEDRGEHHTIIARLRSATVGHACVDQIAGGKVLHVGGVYLSHTAQEHITTAGKNLTLLSGKATDIESKKIEIFADETIRLSTPGGYIELNKSGIVLHGQKIDIQGNKVDFQQGGAGQGAKKPLPES